jgi:hypothetical protein
MNIELEPGSEEARAAGCICDPGQEGPKFHVERMCPVHGLAELARVVHPMDTTTNRCKRCGKSIEEITDRALDCVAPEQTSGPGWPE